MSTRANIIVKDQYSELWFYRHSDGYPEGAMSLIARFVKAVNEGRLRSNVGQSAGWLILMGAHEYDTIRMDLNAEEWDKMMGWKVGSIEPTNGEHGDIEFRYTIELKESGTYDPMGSATVTCESVHRSNWSADYQTCDTSYEPVDVAEYLTGPEAEEAD